MKLEMPDSAIISYATIEKTLINISEAMLQVVELSIIQMKQFVTYQDFFIKSSSLQGS